MGSSSRDLLQLEHNNITAASGLESILLVCKKDSVADSVKSPPDRKPLTTSVAKSQVLGKVKDFLGVISEANKQLQQDSKENAQKYDIEDLTGTESEVIEMDLMLGIADLHTPEAVAAAESAVSSGKHSVPMDSESSDTESEDIDSDNDEEDKTLKHRTSKSGKNDTSEAAGSKGSKKRPKIVEMC